MKVAVTGILCLSMAYDAMAVTEAELDAVCFPYYINNNAVPGSISCWGDAFSAKRPERDSHCTNTVTTPYNSTSQKRYCSQGVAMVGEKCNSQTKNPIEINYGTKFRKEFDIFGPDGAKKPDFVRYFNSRFDPGSGDIGEGWRHSYSAKITLSVGQDGQLGSVMRYVRGDGTSYMLTKGADGIFKSNEHSVRALEIPQAYKGKTKQFYVLLPSSKTLEVFDANANGSYAQHGLLREIWTAGGQFTLIERGVVGQLVSVSDGLSSRRLDFSYYLDANNLPLLLRSVTAPGSNVYEFNYSQSPPLNKYARLINVRRPFSAQEKSIREYSYDEPSLAPKSDAAYIALTGITDVGFPRYASFSYSAGTETVGRAISSELGGGLVVERVSSPKYWDSSAGSDGAYVDMPRGIELTVDKIKVDVTSPSGTVGSVYSQRFNGRMIPTLSTQPAGSGCGASFTEKSSKVFNAAFGSEIASAWGPNDSLTCFDRAVVNGRSVESTRITGLPGTSTGAENLARCSEQLQAASLLEVATKTSTQWHNDWDLPIKIAAPGVITTHVYNGSVDPDTSSVLICAPIAAKLPDGKPIAVLCKTIEEETTDLTGVKGFAAVKASPANRRVTTFKYNQWGQMETKDGPLPGTVDKEFWSYYTAATSGKNALSDLFTYTDAVGNITTYQKYNEAGSPVEVTDANGVMTKYTYDLRDRLSSVEVDGQKTEYVFDKAGRLQKIIRPDGVVTTLEYDAAYRLKAAFDSNGNRIDFVLDGAGNRKSEVMSDRSGAIRKQLTRAFDALGRMSDIQGAAQ